MDGSYTSEHIATLLQSQTTWALPQLIAVTDNAANEKKAFATLKWLRLGCFGHKISNIVYV